MLVGWSFITSLQNLTSLEFKTECSCSYVLLFQFSNHNTFYVKKFGCFGGITRLKNSSRQIPGESSQRYFASSQISKMVAPIVHRGICLGCLNGCYTLALPTHSDSTVDVNMFKICFNAQCDWIRCTWFGLLFFNTKLQPYYKRLPCIFNFSSQKYVFEMLQLHNHVT